VSYAYVTKVVDPAVPYVIKLPIPMYSLIVQADNYSSERHADPQHRDTHRLRSDTCVSVSSRTAPRGRVPNCRGPMATRTSRCTPTPVSKNYVLFTGVLVFVCLRFSLSLIRSCEP
jgi:hypothetical protein